MANGTGSGKFSREAALLIIGATISFISAFLTTVTTNYFDREKDMRMKKFTVLEELSKDVGRRLLYTNQYKNAIDSKDSVRLDTAAKNYRNSVKNWAGKDLMYSIQLSKLFDNNAFVTRVYNPMIELGHFCEYNYSDGKKPYAIIRDTISGANFMVKWDKVRKETDNYISDLYEQIK